ncbi:non-ribosomal peptide synthetase [Gloeocapsa sp. PCC 73106]|uniref:non-ribosomal peptide synthetase n=1 Tax=Gloeocapsa sp. PCC 73106 TaxID=102232 RepID=UPI0002ABBE39|nr:non-ribosomal peptide synthetase [Gloeocapsa sp. PCC 73106]ELR97625.1 non-ribosomal peptide synthase/amino acid adenylation enzyme [Gloeocapsa sp. PCC 73106]
MNNKIDIQKLSPEEKRKLLAELTQKKGAKFKLFPLSFAQSRLWFLDQLESESSAYNLPFALSIKGKLDIALLEKSLNEIIRRHEILRTCFIEVKGEPLQKVLSSLTISLDLTELQEKDIQEHIKKEAIKKFDLTQVPLFRSQLLKLATTEYVLVLTIHHIISDYWSMRVLVQELTAIYQSDSTLLPNLPIQYADYSVWQKQWLETAAKTTQLTYWKKQLEGSPAILQLPTDYPRPSVASFRGSTQYFTLSTELSESLTILSRRQGVTPFITLLAAFKTLLYRYTSQVDILVGSTIANRNRPELGNLIGLLVNNLVFRANLSGNPRFRDFLHQVKETTLNAYTHQDLPYEYIVKELELERDLSYNPLFQVMFILHNIPSQTVQLLDFTLKHLTLESQTARFDLSLDMSETPTGLTGMFEYNTDLFKPETIERLIENFQVLLAGIVANPDQRLSELPLLNSCEEQLLSQWNLPLENYQPVCFTDLFEEQVNKTPDNIAIAFENHSLTYRELNTKANQLAHYLQHQGVKPETKVGICVQRSLEMVIGLLAILKAGGVYLPLDPTYPKERLNYIIQETRASILLTQSTVSEIEVENMIYLDRDWETIQREPTQNLATAVNPQNLAYIIYTSGSTGQPKGVQIEHSALVNFLLSLQEKLSLSPKDTLLAVTTLSFDIAVLELYLPLIVGAKVVLVSQEVSRDGYQLLLNTEEITVMQGTPATWQLLLSVGWSGNKNLKILCGGEMLNTQLAEQLISRGKEVWNLYGPTETTVWSSVYLLKSSEVLIGRPIANTEFYVLDNHLQPLPIGALGELYIGGAGLARGYFNRPGLTAARFIPHASGRLYKTGDLVRYRPDGNLEYLGRLDYQVKIRGFRIELEEIEAVLVQHPDVERVVVMVREDEQCDRALRATLGDRPLGATEGDRRLVAYFTSEKSPDLKGYLQDKLPQYLIPTAFVSVDAFPLTPNGKIDRRSLPVPSTSTLSQDSIVNPRTPTEELLANIWKNVLNLQGISIHADFFALGGHSLLATKVISQIRQSFLREIPLRFLFEAPTIAALAKKIEATQQEAIDSTIVPIKRTETIPLSFAQQRQWFLAQLEPDSPFYNIPAAIHLQGQLDINRLEESFNQVIQRHEILRTAFPTVEGRAVAVIYPEFRLNLPIISESLADIQAEAEKPFQLDELPLFRVKILRLSDVEQIILLTMHHIISDAWSIGILVQEVATLYHGSSLPDLPIQYCDYAAWQKQVLAEKISATQLPYWKKQLESAPTALELPTDYPRPAIQTFQGDTVQFQISSESTKSLKTLTQQQGCTLFMTLLGVFNTLLYRYTNNEDIIVGSPVANRNSNEIEGLIGFFANTLALRTDLSGNPTFITLLQRIKEIALNAYLHQDIPFEQLVNELQLPRDLSVTPLFQVMFVLQNTPIPTLSLSGTRWSPVNVQSFTAKFDLTLYMAETDEGLTGTFEYNTDLFKKETIQRMIGHFQTLIAAIITNPQHRLSELSLLTESERRQIQYWNNTKTEYPQSYTLNQFFEEQVNKTPHEIAVVSLNQQLTYQELDFKSNQLAQYLKSFGIKPEDKIGVCCDRTLDLIIALFGILKIGAAYVPLDPNYPLERIAFTLEDAGCSVILSQQKLSSILPSNQTPVIYIDTDWTKIALESPQKPITSICSDNLVYIIYTSGSTGKPKGVAITHSSAVALIDWAKNTFTPQELKRVLASTSICFDLSVFEIFLPLSCGGAIILAENALELPNLSTEVTLINTVPSAATELLRINGIPESVVTVNLAGEALSNQLVQQLYQKHHIQKVYNLYGPSEDTTYSTFVLTEKGTTKSPSIGRPLPNTHTYILDPYLNPVPINVSGELYLSGEGLARGYLNQPSLTAAKFLPHPFNPSQRLYKTGDLAKYRPDGAIEYLGRLDNQVKLRGFRIELEEIEAILVQHPHISQAIVNAWQDDLGNKRLVAYLISSSIPENLRNFLKLKLPDYMIPSFFIPLESFPLTPNGKIDRQALPHPDSGLNSPTKTLTKASTEIEQQLAQIWSELLGIEEIGIHDNFFELGGDSILAIQAIAKANQIGLKITPKLLFKYQTIALIASIAETSSIQAEQGIVTGYVPLTPIQHWFFNQNLIAPHHWNQSILLEVREKLDPTLLKQATQKLIEHHDALRLRFEQTEHRWQQNIANIGQEIPFIYQESSEIEATANQLQASFNLQVEPLIRLAYFNLGEGRSDRLLLIIHHLIIDGISWRILLEDIQTIYNQLHQQQLVQLPPKTTSFKEWSERQYIPSDLDYWLNESYLQASPLPQDFPGGKNTMSEAKTISVSLTKTETQQLLQEVPIAYHTQINDILLTALVKTFAQWTGKPQLLLELEKHGREDIFNDLDISRTVGWFTTLFPLLLSLENIDGLGAAIKSIKEQLRQIPQQGFSYGMLRYRGDQSTQKKLQALPQPEIRFNYLGQSDQSFGESSLFSLAPESTGISRSPRNQRDILIEINGIVTKGQLQLNWTYSQDIYHQTAIANLAQNYLIILRELIAHCISIEVSSYTPSDFAQMDFNQTELDELLNEL